VLLYHTISKQDWRFATDPAAFSDHLDALVADGRRLCTIADLVAVAPEAGAGVEPGLVVTFDDGYTDNLDVALPLLAERGIPATIFVTTSYIDGSVPAPGQMLSPEGVRELHAAGIEVASHGRRHLSHPRLSRPEIRDEMRSSKAWLEDLIGCEVVSFAYPHGHHDRRCREEAVAAGYRSASIVMNAVARPERDPFAISRLTIERHHGPDAVAAMLQQRPAGPRIRLRARAGSLRRAVGAAVVPGHS
jgi:peptidoglycan/xylan/chitin deacetylase (PgdA/CDA1 family)